MYIEKDAALARRFQSVYVPEPTTEDTLRILQGLKKKYEDHHNVEIPDAVLQSAVSLSARYIPSRFFPDKALDLIDDAASKVRNAVDMAAGAPRTTLVSDPVHGVIAVAADTTATTTAAAAGEGKAEGKKEEKTEETERQRGEFELGRFYRGQPSASAASFVASDPTTTASTPAADAPAPASTTSAAISDDASAAPDMAVTPGARVALEARDIAEVVSHYTVSKKQGGNTESLLYKARVEMRFT
jgi:ATP-dependent Clp protease ATP-binding subunit ClpA